MYWAAKNLSAHNSWDMRVFERLGREQLLDTVAAELRGCLNIAEADSEFGSEYLGSHQTCFSMGLLLAFSVGQFFTARDCRMLNLYDPYLVNVISFLGQCDNQ